jgi:hypothetical protein
MSSHRLRAATRVALLWRDRGKVIARVVKHLLQKAPVGADLIQRLFGNAEIINIAERIYATILPPADGGGDAFYATRRRKRLAVAVGDKAMQ